MQDAALSLLERLTHAHGAPGFEGLVRAIFASELAELPLATDALGNITATLAGGTEHPRLMITGHCDEVGFVVRHITSVGFIEFVANGGWWPHTLLAQRVRILTRSQGEVPGVIGSTPIHFLDETARRQVLPIEKMAIDIGAANRAEAVALGIQPGDPVVPDSSLVRLANPCRLMAKAFDNRVGIAVTIQTLQTLRRNPPAATIFGTGTAQEEVGARGAAVAAAALRPDAALIIEGTPADDGPGSDAERAQGRLGGGVQIRLLDPTTLMSRPLTDLAIAVAREEGIPHQIAVRNSGGTDARSIQAAHLGIPVVVLGVPARYIHSHNSIIDLEDYLATVRLSVAMLRRLDAPTIRGLHAVL